MFKNMCCNILCDVAGMYKPPNDSMSDHLHESG